MFLTEIFPGESEKGQNIETPWTSIRLSGLFVETQIRNLVDQIVNDLTYKEDIINQMLFFLPTLLITPHTQGLLIKNT